MTANLAAHILRAIDTMEAKDGLVAIHAIRSLFNVDKAEFDRTMMELMSNGLEIIAISDASRATQAQLEASIQGVNETLFYVIV